MSSQVANDIALNKLPDAILDALGNRISQAIQDQVIPSAALAIFHYDSPILSAAWGTVHSADTSQAAKASTLYDLGSLTRIYTAVALLSEISDEMVYLHSPIVNIIPEFGTSGPRPIQGGQDPITGKHVRVADSIEGQTVDPNTVNCFHLLTNTSGLPAWRDLYTANKPPSGLPSATNDAQDRWRIAEDKLCQYPFAGLPEMGVIDSDIGYMLMGQVVVRGDQQAKSLEDVINKRILGDRFSRTVFNPLRNEFPQNEIAPSQVHNSWRNRRLQGEVFDENASSVGGVAGHAGLFSTAFEVALFGNVWLNHAQKLLNIDPELSGAATELQAQTGSERFGLGWTLKPPQIAAISDRFSSTSYGQESDIGTSLWIDPTEKLVIVLLSNFSYGEGELVGLIDLRRDIHKTIIEFARR